MPEPSGEMTRRRLLRDSARGACLLGTGAAAVLLAKGGQAEQMVWQIDPHKCIACNNCETKCVLTPSAVKCAHNFEMCGYCKLCFGYYNTAMSEPVGSGSEKQLCPTEAIERKYVTKVAYRYTINEPLCIGCGLCVRGCTQNANGSLHLQIRHDRCVNCNQCTIADACPAEAVVRVPARSPYILKTLHGGEQS